MVEKVIIIKRNFIYKATLKNSVYKGLKQTINLSPADTKTELDIKPQQVAARNSWDLHQIRSNRKLVCIQIQTNQTE